MWRRFWAWLSRKQPTPIALTLGGLRAGEKPYVDARYSFDDPALTAWFSKHLGERKS
jgi:hypothetical protein